MSIATQRTTAGAIEEPSYVPINRRVIFHSPTLVSPEKRTYPQKVAALTYGQVFGGIVGILSLGKMLIDFCFKRAGSFLDKCLIPILGTLTGIILSLNSAKKESDIADNPVAVINPDKNPTGTDSNLLISGQSVSPSIRPQISIHHDDVAIGAGNTTNDSVDELTPAERLAPALRCAVLDDEPVNKTNDEILLERVYDELGFNFKKMPDDEKTLCLRYWFANTYLKHNSKRDGDQYSHAVKLIDEIILANDMSEKVLEARENGTIRLTNAGIVLPSEDLSLRTIRNIFGIPHDSPNSVIIRRQEKIIQLISFLVPSQNKKLETLFYATYFPQAVTAAK